MSFALAFHMGIAYKIWPETQYEWLVLKLFLFKRRPVNYHDNDIHHTGSYFGDSRINRLRFAHYPGACAEFYLSYYPFFY